MTQFERQVRHASDERIANTVLHCIKLLEDSAKTTQQKIDQATAGRVLSICYNECERRGLEIHTP